jgi:hypothetical protein
MGFTAINAGDEFLSAAILNEIVDAINERLVALGQTPMASITDDDVQIHDFFIAVQTAVEGMVTSFVDHTISGGDYSGLDAIPMFTLTTWRAAAGLHADGFTAIDAAGTDHRLLEADDFINKHLVNELQAGLVVLKWTWFSDVVWDSQGEESGKRGQTSQLTEALARTVAKTLYDTAPYDEDADQVVAYGQVYLSDTGFWLGLFERSYSYLKWEGPTSTKDIDFYIRAAGGGALEFDGNGDFPGGYAENTLYLAKTVAAASGSPVYSTAFGKGPPGNYPVEGGADGIKGYACADDPEAVVKWDFAY